MSSIFLRKNAQGLFNNKKPATKENFHKLAALRFQVPNSMFQELVTVRFQLPCSEQGGNSIPSGRNGESVKSRLWRDRRGCGAKAEGYRQFISIDNSPIVISGYWVLGNDFRLIPMVTTLALCEAISKSEIAASSCLDITPRNDSVLWKALSPTHRHPDTPIP